MRAALTFELEAQELPLCVLTRLGVLRVAIHNLKEAGPQPGETLLFYGTREEVFE